MHASVLLTEAMVAIICVSEGSNGLHGGISTGGTILHMSVLSTDTVVQGYMRTCTYNLQ